MVLGEKAEGCVENKQTHLEQGIDVMSWGNPGFTWDEAEEGCISKTRFLMVDASCAEQGIRNCEECLGSREGHDRRMHKMV